MLHVSVVQIRESANTKPSVGNKLSTPVSTDWVVRGQSPLKGSQVPQNIIKKEGILEKNTWEDHKQCEQNRKKPKADNFLQTWTWCFLLFTPGACFIEDHTKRRWDQAGPFWQARYMLWTPADGFLVRVGAGNVEVL